MQCEHFNVRASDCSDFNSPKCRHVLVYHGAFAHELSVNFTHFEVWFIMQHFPSILAQVSKLPELMSY